MPKELERDLGLLSVVAISIGAMVGSGIFILPALAVELAGPAVVLAYVLAGLLVLPAALSKSEMATAMPEAGGTYVYIERAMGPLFGTVAGLGTWFSLSFKGALALVGGVPYLVLIFDLPVTPVALTLGVVLIAVNLLGAKQTGRLQVIVVTVMLAALAWFAGSSAPSVQGARFDAFFAEGVGGLLAATGLVFVSYAGVTKIASVAEEVEDPGTTIPRGILGSLGFTTALYVLIVVVVIGVVPTAELAGSHTPVADAAAATLAGAGVIVVVLAAILALVSTANAGILSASRYPFAMSRDGLIPTSFSEISERFDTPSTAITLTGAVLLFLIAFVPIMEIAKLASAFQILVFVLVTISHVALRESGVESYDPEWTAPLYPWMQVFGTVGGLVLLTQMGTIPLVGAVLITGAGSLWYLAYARPRVDRDGALHESVRRSAGDEAVERTRETMAADDPFDVTVALPEDADEDRERALLSIADGLVRDHEGRLTAVRFDQVPDQMPLSYASTRQSAEDLAFEERTDDLARSLETPVRYGEIVSHDPKRAVANHAASAETDLLVVDQAVSYDEGWLADGSDWIRRHAPCDTLLVDAEDVTDVDEIAVVTTRGPDDSLKVSLATALADYADAALSFVYPYESDTPADRRAAVAEYHADLSEMCPVPTESRVVDRSDLDDALSPAAVVLYSQDDGLLARLSGRPDGFLPDGLDSTAIEVATDSGGRPGFGPTGDRSA